VPSPDGDDSETFHASVTDDETGAIYSIGPDADGNMMVTERYQEDMMPELDPDEDDMDQEERALLNAHHERMLQEEELNSGGLRGSYYDQSHRSLAKTQIGVVVAWTRNAECRVAGKSLPCTRTSSTTSAMRGKINLAVEETNTAYELSGINAELKLVHAYYTSFDEGSTDFSGALSWFKGSSEASARRKTYGGGKCHDCLYFTYHYLK
jgi:hypothetical protein